MHACLELSKGSLPTAGALLGTICLTLGVPLCSCLDYAFSYLTLWLLQVMLAAINEVRNPGSSSFFVTGEGSTSSLLSLPQQSIGHCPSMLLSRGNISGVQGRVGSKCLHLPVCCQKLQQHINLRSDWKQNEVAGRDRSGTSQLTEL